MIKTLEHDLRVRGLQTDDAAVVGITAHNHSTGRSVGPFEGTSKRATGDPRNAPLGEALATLRAVRALEKELTALVHSLAGGHCEGVDEPLFVEVRATGFAASTTSPAWRTIP